MWSAFWWLHTCCCAYGNKRSLRKAALYLFQGAMLSLSGWWGNKTGHCAYLISCVNYLHCVVTITACQTWRECDVSFWDIPFLAQIDVNVHKQLDTERAEPLDGFSSFFQVCAVPYPLFDTQLLRSTIANANTRAVFSTCLLEVQLLFLVESLLWKNGWSRWASHA